ncbi:hypothetical protein K2173_015382 [Erythroxylum novogranatense]|uniref:cellulase n=1 Tax=Erythroxylum novogranatense TaxID=1862640 RepID=A0AAV8SRK4_9ROSI|nr:hypothetical protein K2173_015382 [Erythroxylum novogranatense]
MNKLKNNGKGMCASWKRNLMRFSQFASITKQFIDIKLFTISHKRKIGWRGKKYLNSLNLQYIENIDYHRPVFECHGCSDLVVEMTAALASASIAFKDNKDGFIWGGAWLCYATRNASYLQRATTPGPDYGILSWDNKLTDAQVFLSCLRLFLSPSYPYKEILQTFHNQTNVCAHSYQISKVSTRPMLNHGRPQSLQYVVNATFLATQFSDYLEAADTLGWYHGPNFYYVNALRQFARAQMDYILGNNPRKMSYVVSFGNHFARHVHHWGASILKNKIKYNCKGGWKWRHDGFHDVRTNYNYTEPILASNAGLVAALVALSGDKTIGVDKNTIFSAVPPMFITPPPPPLPREP